MRTKISHCDLLHHGAAANSSRKVIACIPTADGNVYEGDDGQKDTNLPLAMSELVYASHLMLNVAKPKVLTVPHPDVEENTAVEKIWSVDQTLRTRTSLTEAEAETAAANVSTRTAKRTITCVAQLGLISEMGPSWENCQDVVLVCGFSDGTLTSWHRSGRQQDWEEYILLKSTRIHEDQKIFSKTSLERDAVTTMKGRSITDIDGYIAMGNCENHNKEYKRRLELSLVAGSSAGAHYFEFNILLRDHSCTKENNLFPQEVIQDSEDAIISNMKKLIRTPSNSINFHTIRTSSIKIDGRNACGLFLVGTAAPRQNKIHIFEKRLPKTKGSTPTDENQTSARKNAFASTPMYSGCLTGHEDWITCFNWSRTFTHTNKEGINKQDNTSRDSYCYLASGSQDAKIRLWKWVTTETIVSTNTTCAENEISDVIRGVEINDIGSTTTDSVNDDEEDDDDEEVIEGEARLEIHHGSKTENYQWTTSIYLEALLIGHEEMVTSVAWHPNPKKMYDRDLVLFSSSMDRSIFLWSSTGYQANESGDGVWTPIARVGSPSGILGGPVGSSLLGYLNVQVEPEHGRWIVGHAYGGALHFFSGQQYINSTRIAEVSSRHINISQEDQVVVKWEAQPCITGHFDEVNDLCWEALEGEYLVTVGNDATCRIWAPTTSSLDTWIEIARPQVHGYSLLAVTSLSTSDHKHRLVTGADEKELRVFDGTKSFLRVLNLVKREGDKNTSTINDTITRVDRAYMPSLGLSNKDTASEGADEDTGEASSSSSILPIEKDLGSSTLWPEILKIYGHNSEIARLSSTLSSRTCLSLKFSSPYEDQNLVASSTKARDINTASIRVWDVNNNRCLQTLLGGHRSTVTAMNFSPDGTYLATSGKDRRLCIWKRCYQENQPRQKDVFHLVFAINSSHKRIVWSVHFCPYNPTILASGSRDGTIKLWKIIDALSDREKDTIVKEYSQFIPSVGKGDRSTKNKPKAVTSLSFSPSTLFGKSRGILAVGLDNGFIQLWNVPLLPNSNDYTIKPPLLAKAFDPHLCHIGAIKKLAWRPTRKENDERLILASCASDNGCRIFSLWLRIE